jgi:hypothetical protein
MISIQIITNEWIDIIILDNENNIAKRKINNDSGIFNINENILEINWDIWGKEVFIRKNDIFYNCKDNNFEIILENTEWQDIGIFNNDNNTIVRKYFPNEYGTFIFDNNDLIINWNNWGNERFYQLNYGKYYTNTKFGNIIKNNIKKEIKLLAIVFPQFHEIPENNLFWGDGFTEWTLLKNIPRIVNNEIIKQPHSDIGYFNLKDYEHRKYMRILADKYNIYGFCYYHYWFKDKKVMYEPTELMLIDNEPNKPFLFCWANEQWTKRWDGGNNEVLLHQDYSDNDGNINHFNYLLQFFKHKNYIKKFNKPIFIFYRIEEKDINYIRNIIKLWNKMSIIEGFNGIHFMRFLGPFNNNIVLEEIDGYVEFEPGYACQKYYSDICIGDDNKIFNEYDEDLYLKKNSDIKQLVIDNKIFKGYDHYILISENERNIRTSKFFVYNGIELYNKIINLERVHNEQHRGISVNWNNTPRRNYISDEYDKYPHYYKNINPIIFGDYFKKLLNKINNDKNNDNDFLFISAWNEWNEQAILEPNNKDGYDYLQEINNQYLDFYNNPKKYNILNICHSGGGTEKYMNDLKNIFKEHNFINFTIFDSNINYNEKYRNINLIHINSILFNNLKDNYIKFFLLYMIDVPKYLTIHDYQWLYPDNPNIIKDDFKNNSPKIENIISFELLISICSKIIFPSNNIYNNYNIYIDLNKYKNKIFIVNHCDIIINNNFLVIPKIDNIINISFIGYFVDYKGSYIFEDLINKYKFYKNYKLNYHIFGIIGYNINDNIENITIHKEYKDDNIINELHENNIHGILHLSIFEESYCYALTKSINSGIPILYINNGCISERLNDNNKYFSSELNDIMDRFIIFLDYIIENNDIYNFYNLNNNIQPNKWYLTNYIEKKLDL